MVATLSFMISVHFYWYHERRLGLSRDNRLVDTLDFRASKLGDLTQSLYAYWIGIFVLRILVPVRQIPDGIPQDTFDVFHLFCEVFYGLFAYDAVFFVIHWLLHEVSLLRRFHRLHHHACPPNTVEARDVLRHSFIDGLLQVLCNIFVQQRNHLGNPKSRCARALHNVLLTWMLVESHTAAPKPDIWRRWFVGVRNHRVHHLGLTKKRQHESYQQFFGYLDSLREWIQSSRDDRKP
jgi:sterol desaturase/sphingolipid hydroxylase (fatty acid hydroxylase superfamily)